MIVADRGKSVTIVFFLIPGLVLYGLLVLIPLVQGMGLSTLRWITLSDTRYIGLDNYVRIFNDPIFWKSVKNSLIFMAGTTALQVVLGFVFGYFMYQQLRGYRLFRTIYFIPVVLMSIAVGFVWKYIYSPSFGLLKPFMEAIGLGERYFPPLASPKAALLLIIFASVWQFVGIQILLFYAGFMNMPQEVLEMATIDGAHGFSLIWHMVLPLSWEVTKMVIVLQLIGSLRAFDLIFVMTVGGPNHATEVLPMHMFVQAFQNFNIGRGSAVAVVIFVLAMSLTVISRRLMRREALQY